MDINNNKEYKIDRVDKEIIRLLSFDGRLSVANIARRIGASKTPVQVRLKRLLKQEYILGFRAILNPKKLKKEHIAFTEVKLLDTREKSLNEFNRAVIEIPEIEQCHMIAGSFDFLLKTRTKDIVSYRYILGEAISSLPNVSSTSTFVAMESIKDNSF